MDKQLNNPLELQESSILFGMNGSEHGKFKAGFMGVHNLLHVQDQKATGTNGGDFTAGAWRTRTLNTVVLNNIDGAICSNDLITLPAGKYYVEGFVPAVSVVTHVARLYNNTATVSLVNGSSSSVNSSVGATTESRVCGVFTLESQSVVALQHRCNTTKTVNGLGWTSDVGQSYEIYSDLKIWKLA